MRRCARWLSTWGIGVAAVTLLLSVASGVPYAYTIAGFAAWAFLGHLVTLDDDVPEGPTASPDRWRASLAELALKLLVLIALVAAIAASPALRGLGSG